METFTYTAISTIIAYRGDGLRDSRTVGMTTTQFTWDINAGLPVVLDDGNRYVYGAGLESMVTGTGGYYYLADGLGSTMAVVDSAGAVQKSYTYDVYGEATASGTLSNEFDFAGQQTDASTGLQYLRARYMDPETGIFMSREPLSLLVGWTGNPFTYGSGNSLRYVDPSGLRSCDIDSCDGNPRLDLGNCYQTPSYCVPQPHASSAGTTPTPGSSRGDASPTATPLTPPYQNADNPGPDSAGWSDLLSFLNSKGLVYGQKLKEYEAKAVVGYTAQVAPPVHAFLQYCATHAGCRNELDSWLANRGPIEESAASAPDPRVVGIVKYVGLAMDVLWDAYTTRYDPD